MQPSGPPSANAWIAAAVFAAVACGVLIPLFARLAGRLGLMDHPGGRKAHAGPVPLVGGIAIFLAVLGAGALVGNPPLAWFGAAVVIVGIGAWDDAVDLRPRWRFAAQILASCVMIAAGGVELQGVGDLLGAGRIGLWIFVLPMTVFAVVGVINSMNMLDGTDGLAGSTALVALLWYAGVAGMEGLASAFAIAVLHAAALVAFLGYNLRLPGRPRALVFLGDAGSMLLGFALAWLAVDLTQGPGRTFPPIAALWVVLLPLADCVSLMARRLGAGRSPFSPDRQHIHHYMIARGFSHPQALAVLVGISAMFGAVGFLGWRLGVAEPVLFWVFFFAFLLYHAWMKREWRRLEAVDPVPRPLARQGENVT